MGTAARRFYLAFFFLCCSANGHDNKLSTLSHEHEEDSCAIDPNSIVSDACASYSTLDSLNSQLRPQITALTRNSDFFSYYRLNLFNKACPFWSDDSGMCGNIACAVSTIENEEDIPLIWRAEELGKLEGPKAHHPDRDLQQEQKPLLGELGAEVGESCVVEYDDECDDRDYCVPEDERATSKGDYVSLVDNPERFTGYSGPAARHVWEAIYRENCFSKSSENVSSTLPGMTSIGSQKGRAALALKKVMRNPSGVERDNSELEDECLEKRTFYRIISGMHASISTHLCWEYLNQTTGEWAPNAQCYEQRLHPYPDRVSNLYFNYALILRAIEKVCSAFGGYTFCSGDAAQDYATKQRVISLAKTISAAPKIYDESLMFQDSSFAGLKEDFRNRFRNVSRTMDCVGCDKCRLWGKLQIAGYGTALKILFEFDENDPSNNPPLRRTELVALINTLDRLSHSLMALNKFREMAHPELKVDLPSMVEKYQPDEAEPEDDGLNGQETTPKAETFLDDFKKEFAIVSDTVRWVLQQWMEFPGLAWKIFVVQMNRLWNFWLGTDVYPAVYYFHYQRHDET